MHDRMAEAAGVPDDSVRRTSPGAESPLGAGPARGTGLTARTIAIALVLILLLLLAALYLEFVTKLAYSFTTLVPPIAPLAVLFLLALLNPRLSTRRGLSRRERPVAGAPVRVGGRLPG